MASILRDCHSHYWYAQRRGWFTTAVYSNGTCTTPVTGLATARQSLPGIPQSLIPRGESLGVGIDCGTLAPSRTVNLANYTIYKEPGVALSIEEKVRYLKSLIQIDCNYEYNVIEQAGGPVLIKTNLTISGNGMELLGDDADGLRKRLELCGRPVDGCGWSSDWYREGQGPYGYGTDKQFWWYAKLCLEAVSTDFACIEKALAWLGAPQITTCWSAQTGHPPEQPEPEFPDEGIKGAEIPSA